MTSTPRGSSLEEWFWSRVDKGRPSECWVWAGCLNQDGYGAGLRRNGVYHSAHRASWYIHNGEVPSGLEVDHLCRNRACVNPNHLRVTTHRENVLASTGTAAFNAVKTHCSNGHAFDEANTATRARAEGGRQCRKCAAIATAKYRANKAAAQA